MSKSYGSLSKPQLRLATDKFVLMFLILYQKLSELWFLESYLKLMSQFPIPLAQDRVPDVHVFPARETNLFTWARHNPGWNI